MVSPLNDWFRYAVGVVAVALGFSLCFAPKEKLLMQLGSKRAPAGAKPIPRWVGALMSLSIAFIGVGLLAYRFIANRFAWATPIRQACVAAVCVGLTWGLGQLFAGLNACPNFLNVDRDNYRGSAFLGAFVCLLFALAAAYIAFVAR